MLFFSASPVCDVFWSASSSSGQSARPDVRFAQVSVTMNFLGDGGLIFLTCSG